MGTSEKNKVISMLQAARALIAKGWCREGAAKAANRQFVGFDDPAAVRFCALGAAWKVGQQNGNYPLDRDLGDYAAVKGINSVITFNDSKRNKREVLKFYDRVIAWVDADRPTG